MTRDDQLAFLIADAVADVEPADRLEEIRIRTGGHTPLRWWAAGVSGALAAAAVVTAVAVVGHDPAPTTDPGPATSPTEAVESEGPLKAFPVYLVGDTPNGPRLYREFRPWDPDETPGALALLEEPPADPDYSSFWSDGQLTGFRLDVDTLVVTVDPSVRERPAGMSEADAQLAVQQVVYTAQAIAQERLPVQFRTEDNPIDQVYGVPTSEPVVNAEPVEVLSLVNLADPGEGQVVEGGSLAVKGVANSYEATVPWRVEGTPLSGFFTALGANEPKLFPFSGPIDVSSLDPGTYTLIVETSDPSGGAEGNGPYVDSRTFVIE